MNRGNGVIRTNEGDASPTCRAGWPKFLGTTGSPSEPLEPLGAPGETIEDAAGDATGEAILIDLPGTAGDGVEDMDESAANAVLGDGVEPPPFMEDTLEGGGGLGGDDFGGAEDGVEHMDDPVF